MGHSEWGRPRTQLTRCVLSPACVIAHVGVYLVISSVLVLLNAIRSPGELWFWRPLLVLGALLALHAAVIMAAGRTSRLRVVAALMQSGWSRLAASRSSWTVGDPRRSAPYRSLTTWVQSRQPKLGERPANGPVAAPAMVTAPRPNGWIDIAPFESWPVAPTAPAPAPAWPKPASAWPEPAPSWSASWPAPVAARTTPLVRPTGTDTVLNGMQGGDPENPRWDQLEVAATSWLAHRAADTATESAR